MKTVPMIATLFAAVVAVSVPSLAEASNYKDICRSTRLNATERKECRAYMKAAENDAQEAGSGFPLRGKFHRPAVGGMGDADPWVLMSEIVFGARA